MSGYDVVCLSPHLDDAVFSCGGRLFEECRSGRSVLIVTVTAGEPEGAPPGLARKLERKAGLGPNAVAARRAEDREAATALGAEVLHWPLLDAVYRRDPGSGEALYPTLRRLYGPPHPGDRRFENRLRALIESLPAHRELLLPLALGGHVDHRLVRGAAEEHGRSVHRYWEDFPYAARLVTRLRELPPSGGSWRSETVALSEEALAARCRAMARYASQVRLTFGGPERMATRVRRMLRRAGGERYWWRASATQL